MLRTALLLIAGAAIAGTALELAIERHWQNLEQWYAWLALAIAAAGLIALLVWPGNLGVWFARLCAAIAMAMAAVGVWRHIHANYETAPLDFRYSERWDTMAFADQLWAVVSGDVGPSPILASGVLALIGLALGAATLGLPRPTTSREDG